MNCVAWRCCNEFAIEQLVAEPGVEAFTVSIFPGWSRFDVSRLGANSSDPVPHFRGNNFRPIVSSYVFLWAAQNEQVSQCIQHICWVEFTIAADHMCLPCVFIDDVQCPIGSPVSSAILDEVIGPDMVRTFRLEAHARTIVQPELPLLFCFCGTFSPSRRRSTRLWFTCQPALFGKPVTMR